MNFSFVVPLTGIESLAEGLPDMLRDLKKQAERGIALARGVTLTAWNSI